MSSRNNRLAPGTVTVSSTIRSLRWRDTGRQRQHPVSQPSCRAPSSHPMCTARCPEWPRRLARTGRARKPTPRARTTTVLSAVSSGNLLTPRALARRTVFAAQSFVGADLPLRFGLPEQLWETAAVRRPTCRDRQAFGHSRWLRELLSTLPALQ